MRTKEEIKQLIEFAREQNMPYVEIDGVKFPVPKIVAAVPELKAEEIVHPLGVFDDLSDEEILYWSTPYGEELEEKRKQQAEHAKEKKQ